MAGEVGLEPTTNGLTVRCTAIVLLAIEMNTGATVRALAFPILSVLLHPDDAYGWVPVFTLQTDEGTSLASFPEGKRALHQSALIDWPKPILGMGCPHCCKRTVYLRRERDLNPRWDNPHSCFQDRRIRPLCHLSLLPSHGYQILQQRIVPEDSTIRVPPGTRSP